MPGETFSLKKDLLMYVNSLAQIKIILKDCMNTQVNLVITFYTYTCLLVKQSWSSNFLLLSWIEDTTRRIIDTLSEVNRLSMLGGGVGVGVGIRTSDNKSTGVMSHLILTMLVH